MEPAGPPGRRRRRCRRAGPPRAPPAKRPRSDPDPARSDGDRLFAQKCRELQGFIRPLAELLDGLRAGRYDKGLSTFQQSVAMDRIQRIIGVLQKPQMGGRYLGTLLQVEVMLKLWFPHVAPKTAAPEWRRRRQRRRGDTRDASPAPAATGAVTDPGRSGPCALSGATATTDPPAGITDISDSDVTDVTVTDVSDVTDVTDTDVTDVTVPLVPPRPRSLPGFPPGHGLAAPSPRSRSAEPPDA